MARERKESLLEEDFRIWQYFKVWSHGTADLGTCQVQQNFHSTLFFLRPSASGWWTWTYQETEIQCLCLAEDHMPVVFLLKKSKLAVVDFTVVPQAPPTCKRNRYLHENLVSVIFTKVMLFAWVCLNRRIIELTSLPLSLPVAEFSAVSTSFMPTLKSLWVRVCIHFNLLCGMPPPFPSILGRACGVRHAAPVRNGPATTRWFWDYLGVF